jgi:hypothetical protein
MADPTPATISTADIERITGPIAGDDAPITDLPGSGSAYSKVAENTTTLSSGSAIADTGVSTDNSNYTINFNPGAANIAATLDGSGTTYAIRFSERGTTVENPTVSWQLLRSQL